MLGATDVVSSVLERRDERTRESTDEDARTALRETVREAVRDGVVEGLSEHERRRADDAPDESEIGRAHV